MLRADLVEFVDVIPDNVRCVRGWDLASTEKERIKDDPDSTSGTLAGFDGDTLWIKSVENGKWSALERDKKISDTAAKDGRGALHWAARHGRLDVARWLLRDCGVAPDVATRDGTTPLHLAAWQGHVAVCALLAEAAPNAATAANLYGCAAVHWAALRDDNAGAMCAWLRAAGADWRARNGAGHAPLHKACTRGAASLVTWLLSPDGGDCADLVDAPDADGNTPLALAAIWGSHAVVVVLLRHGASPDAHSPPAGATPLAWAVHMGHDDVAEALRDAGADEGAAEACGLPARHAHASEYDA